MKCKNLLLLMLFSIVVFLPSTFAHDVTLVYTTIVVDNRQAQVLFTAPLSNFADDSNMEDLPFLGSGLLEGLALTNNNKTCSGNFRNVSLIQDSKSAAFDFTYECNQNMGTFRFDYNLFYNLSQNHENVVTLIRKNGTQSEAILSRTDSAVEFEIARDTLSSGFFLLGVQHILSGYDHLLFLLGLLLFAKRLLSLVKIITSFTIAHSITLGLAALDIVVLPARLTEILIALSIVYIAVENLYIAKGKSLFGFGNESNRWIVTFFFGLIHGFGFSGVLRDIGLPKDNVLWSLFTFNIGIEVVQIFLAVVAFRLLALKRKDSSYTNVATHISMIVGGFGLLWFVQRLFF